MEKNSNFIDFSLSFVCVGLGARSYIIDREATFTKRNVPFSGFGLLTGVNHRWLIGHIGYTECSLNGSPRKPEHFFFK